MRHTVRILSLSILVALAGAAIGKPKPAPAPAPAAQAAPAAPAGAQGTTAASVYKDNVAVHQAAQPASPTVTTLNKGSAVDVQKQEGLWFNVKAQPSTVGYVKINEIRLAKASGGNGNDGYSMFGGHPKPSETAGVRGINEEQLRGATFDPAAVARMETFRVDDATANAYASRMHLQKTDVAYKKEPGLGEGHRATSGSSEQTQVQEQQNHAAKVGAMSMIGGHFGLGVSASTAADAMPKSEQEKVDEEIAMGPQLAGRVLSVLPLLNDPTAQRRVNTIGRWVALQTPRDDLPWTFAVVDSPEMNAFAAPGGYIIVTRGLYEVLQSDDEVAADQQRQVGPDERHGSEQVDDDLRAPIAHLPPRQHIAHERGRHHQQVDDQPEHPDQLARCLVTTEIEPAEDVDIDHHEEHAGAIGVGIAQHPAGVDVAHDALDAVEGAIGRSEIMHRQHDPGDDLHGQHQPGEDSEIPEIVEVARDRIAATERAINQARERQTLVEPATEVGLGLIGT